MGRSGINANPKTTEFLQQWEQALAQLDETVIATTERGATWVHDECVWPYAKEYPL